MKHRKKKWPDKDSRKKSIKYNSIKCPKCNKELFMRGKRIRCPQCKTGGLKNE